MDNLALISGSPLGPTAATLPLGEGHTSHNRLESHRLMLLAWRDKDRQHNPMTITDQVNLGAKASPRTSQRMVFWLFELRRLVAAQCTRLGGCFFLAPAAARLARMTEASMHHSSG